MASTYSPNLRLELIGTGEQQGTWGVTTNTNLGTLLEEAIGGYTSVTVTDGADTTLSTNNGSADQSRNMTINLTGALTAARNVICPAIEKVYIVKNATTGGYAVTFKVSGQTGVSIPNGSTYILYVNGSDAVLATGTIAAQNSNNVSITGGSITGITDLAVADGGTGASDAATARTNLGIGTIATQNANNVSITGGSITGITDLAIADGGTGASDAATARTNLGIGTIATQNANNVSITGGSITGITDLAVADGGTGASTAAGAATNLGLGTGDSPQFAAVNIGNATDTTITRSSAGVIAVEGGIVPLQNRTNTFTANQIVEVTDNTNAALRITQLGTGNALLVEDSTNPDATPLVVNNDGVIVSGYTTTATIANSLYRAYLLGSGSYYPLAAGYTGASALGPLVGFAKSRGADWATRGIVSNGDTIGGLVFAADDGSTLNSIGAVIQASVDGTPGVGDMPGRLAFFTTADGASSSTERMRIRSDGGIGIGGTGSASISLSLQKSITGGTTAIGVDISATVLSDVTTGALGYNTSIATQAASFSTILQHYRATQSTIGAGSTVSLQIGFSSTSTLIGATDNQAFRAADTAAVTSGKIAYGFYSAVNTATGGGTTYGFYSGGTARNLFSGDVQVFGAGGLGYTTGSGGAVTQGTSRTTGVTLDKTNGAITLFSAAGTTTWQSFTVTNSTVAATDTIIVCQKSGTDPYELHVTAVSAGSFRISFRTTGGTTTEQPVFNFAVIKAVTA